MDGVEEFLVFQALAGGGHPVGGELDVGEALNGCAGEIGEDLAHGHAGGGLRVEDGEGRAFAECHGLAGRFGQVGGVEGA